MPCGSSGAVFLDSSFSMCFLVCLRAGGAANSNEPEHLRKECRKSADHARLSRRAGGRGARTNAARCNPTSAKITVCAAGFNAWSGLASAMALRRFLFYAIFGPSPPCCLYFETCKQCPCIYAARCAHEAALSVCTLHLRITSTTVSWE